MSIGIGRDKDITALHKEPETTVLNLGSGIARSQSLASSTRHDKIGLFEDCLVVNIQRAECMR